MDPLKKKIELINESFKIIEREGWGNFSIKKLSETKKMSLNEVTHILKSRNNLINEFSYMIDKKVENDFDFKELDKTSIKDNLFELIMLRLEYLNPYRNALKEIIKSFKTDPQLAKIVSTNVLNSLDFYLEISNAYKDNFFDVFKKKSIFIIYGYVFTIWMQDDSDELSKTMSELDRLLTFSEKLAINFKNYTPF